MCVCYLHSVVELLGCPHEAQEAVRLLCCHGDDQQIFCKHIRWSAWRCQINRELLFFVFFTTRKYITIHFGKYWNIWRMCCCMLVTLSPVCRHEQLPEFPCRLLLGIGSRIPLKFQGKSKRGGVAWGRRRGSVTKAPAVLLRVWRVLTCESNNTFTAAQGRENSSRLCNKAP